MTLGSGASRAALLAVLAALMLIGVGIGAGPADAEEDEYLWLAAGDSYTAGEGVPDDHGKCQLSLFAYPLQASRSYGDSDDAWAQIFAPDKAPSRTSDDTSDVWRDDIDPPLPVPSRGGAIPRPAEINGRDGDYKLNFATFKDFWEGRATTETVPIDQRWAACSGARTEDLFLGRNGRPPQLELLDNRRADFITMSMGGNDVGFATILANCFGDSTGARLLTGFAPAFTESDCKPSPEELRWRADYLLEPDDDDVNNRFGANRATCAAGSRSRHAPEGADLDRSEYRCSLETSRDVDPNSDGMKGTGLVDVYIHMARQHLKEDTGRLLIVGYPRFFATASENDPGGCDKFTQSDVKLLNNGAEYFDATLRKAVDLANAQLDGNPVVYRSVLAAFDDNGLCGPGEDWLNAINIDTESDNPVSDSFHPTRAGHDGMTELLKSELEQFCAFQAYRDDRSVADACSTSNTSDLAGGGDSIFGIGSSSTVMVLDISNSMNDPTPVQGGETPVPKIQAVGDATQDLISVVRIDAGDGFDHSVGIVAFNNDATVVTRSTVDLDGAASDAASLAAFGDTDVGAGLELGISMVLRQADVKRIVLLSDGDITDGLNSNQVLDQIVPLAVRQSIPIDVIGYAEPGSLNDVFLNDVATQTNGTFSTAASKNELRGDFIRARHETVGDVELDITGSAAPDLEKPLASFEVESGKGSLVVSLGFDDDIGDLELVLVDPMNLEVPADEVKQSGTNPVTLQLGSPMPGTWRVYGAKPDEIGDIDPIWRPPIDGATADSSVRPIYSQESADASSARGDIPFVLVVSTRQGAAEANFDVAVTTAETPRVLAFGLLALSVLSLVFVALHFFSPIQTSGSAEQLAFAGTRRSVASGLLGGSVAGLLMLGLCAGVSLAVSGQILLAGETPPWAFPAFTAVLGVAASTGHVGFYHEAANEAIGLGLETALLPWALVALLPVVIVTAVMTRRRHRTPLFYLSLAITYGLVTGIGVGLIAIWATVSGPGLALPTSPDLVAARNIILALAVAVPVLINRRNASFVASLARPVVAGTAWLSAVLAAFWLVGLIIVIIQDALGIPEAVATSGSLVGANIAAASFLAGVGVPVQLTAYSAFRDVTHTVLLGQADSVPSYAFPIVATLAVACVVLGAVWSSASRGPVSTWYRIWVGLGVALGVALAGAAASELVAGGIDVLVLPADRVDRSLTELRLTASSRGAFHQFGSRALFVGLPFSWWLMRRGESRIGLAEPRGIGKRTGVERIIGDRTVAREQ